MNGFTIRYLGYFGPDKPVASVSLNTGLNVICGASETGKSFIAESIDFMLGQEFIVRDIPERAGYDRVRMLIESTDWPPLALERSVEGGNLRAYSEALADGAPQSEPSILRWKHSAARQDTLSHHLLQRSGLAGKLLRRNANEETRSLSFRDLARLCIVTEEEIQTRNSPLLSGQYVSATAEYAAFKLLLTGIDDSSLVAVTGTGIRQEQGAAKAELLDQMISELQLETDESGAEEVDLIDQLTRLEASISDQKSSLFIQQKRFDGLLESRALAAREIRDRRARLIEIDELVGRFDLLDTHYATDINRLLAIHESGSLLASVEPTTCPLCGALPGDQHLDTPCEGNVEAIVVAADAEITKIKRLRDELRETVRSLATERDGINESLRQYEQNYTYCEKELADIAAPVLSSERSSYDELVAKRADVRMALEKYGRLKRLNEQRAALEGRESERPEDAGRTRTLVSKSILDEFSKTIEQILEEWHFPNASRVFFDEAKRDFQISGKDRGSTGKGLRAITHAAVNIGLMEFCREKGLPHPGFVVLDSPLLAYWKPEGEEDDLRGTDLDEKFYRYLLGISQENQVIVIENKHPPSFVVDEGNVVVFTKNPHQGRYGFFPEL